MYCPNCGAEIPDGASVCLKCGVPIPSNNASSLAQIQRAPKSIGGFICGLLGFLLDWLPVVGLILSIVGVALCGNGKKEVQKNPSSYENTGLLTAGLVLGIIGIVASSIVLLVTLVWGIILGNGGFFSILEELIDLCNI